MPPTHTSEGLVAAAAIRARMPEVGVLVLSQYVDADYALKLLREHPAGTGYLLKDRITQLDTLLDAIQRVDRGETVVDRELVELLLNQSATSDRLERLSEREREVLALVAEGLTDRAIAERLWLTRKTVETHVRHILVKLALPADNRHNRRVLAVLTFLHSGALAHTATRLSCHEIDVRAIGPTKRSIVRGTDDWTRARQGDEPSRPLASQHRYCPCFFERSPRDRAGSRC